MTFLSIVRYILINPNDQDEVGDRYRAHSVPEAAHLYFFLETCQIDKLTGTDVATG